MKSTQKKGYICHNNPFKVKNDIEPLVGQRRQAFNEPDCKFTEMRYRWRAAFLFMFQSWEYGNQTVREIVTDVFPADEGYDAEKLLIEIQKCSWLTEDCYMLSPLENVQCWYHLAERIAIALNRLERVKDISEMWIGWAMAWCYYFDEHCEYSQRDI